MNVGRIYQESNALKQPGSETKEALRRLAVIRPWEVR